MSNYNFFNPAQNQGAGTGLTPEQILELEKISEIDEKVEQIQQDLSSTIKYVEI